MNVTLGMPRITEIIDAVKKIRTPIINAKLINEENPVAARIVKGRIEKTELGDIADYIKEVYTPEGCYLVVKIDMETVNKLKLEVCDSKEKGPDGKSLGPTLEGIKRSILKGKLKLKEHNVIITKGNKLKIEPYDTSKEKMYFEMQKLKSKLPRVIVWGLPSIVRAVITKQDKSEELHKLIIEGYGLKKVMLTPGIDFRKTSTNHVIETWEELGIEAARQKIIDEISIQYEQYGIYPDQRHLSVLADVMTNKGQILGI
jgi:DNA-directed RNA polymerase III subunit RPC1